MDDGDQLPPIRWPSLRLELGSPTIGFTLPARLAQSVEHVFVVLGPNQGLVPAHVEIEADPAKLSSSCAALSRLIGSA